MDPNANLSGPSSAHQQNAILMGFHWRADDGPSGLVAKLFSSGSDKFDYMPFLLICYRQTHILHWISGGYYKSVFIKY